MALRLGGQLRAVPGAVIGYDFNAAFALAAGFGIDPAAVSNLLPGIESVAVAAMNERHGGAEDGDGSVLGGPEDEQGEDR